MAALSVKENISPARLSVRKVQNQLLQDGAYLLPYLDVPKEHPRFKVYQRIGATGILKGTGMNVGWENQTWFFPDKDLSQDDMDHALSVLRQFKNVETPKSLKNSDMLEWFDSIRGIFNFEEIVSNVDKRITKLYKITNENIAAHEVMKRGDFAELMDANLDPFQIFSLDINGNYIKD